MNKKQKKIRISNKIAAAKQIALNQIPVTAI